MLVADASVVVQACLSTAGLDPLRSEVLVAPPLLRSEVPSVLHELGARGAVSPDLSSEALDRFLTAPISIKRPASLIREAWAVADDLGWAKTYDAEYVALARILDCPLITIDARLQRGADRVVTVIPPTAI